MKLKKLVSVLLSLAIVLGVLPNITVFAEAPPADGATVIVGPYELKYNYTIAQAGVSSSSFRLDTTLEGWGCRTVDRTLSEYPPVPSMYDGYPVKVFGGYRECNNITNLDWLDIPSHFKWGWCFMECSGITDIDLDLSHTNIEIADNMFYGMKNLKTLKIKLPDTTISMKGTITVLPELIDLEIQVPGSVDVFHNNFSNLSKLKDYSKITFSDYSKDYSCSYSGYINGSKESPVVKLMDRLPAKMGYVMFNESSVSPRNIMEFSSDNIKIPDLYDGTNVVFTIKDDTAYASSFYLGSTGTGATIPRIKKMYVEGDGSGSGSIVSPNMEDIYQGRGVDDEISTSYKTVGNLHTTNTRPIGGSYKNLYLGEGVKTFSLGVVKNTRATITVTEGLYLPSTMEDLISSDFVTLDGKGSASIYAENGLPNLRKVNLSQEYNRVSEIKGFDLSNLVFGPSIIQMSGLKSMVGNRGAVKVYKNTYASSFMSNIINNPNLQVVELDIIEPGSISINPSNVSIGIGETKKLTANVRPTTTVDKSVTWKSLNTNIATIDSSGIVTGKSTGQTYIIATTSNGLESECLVTVKKTTPVSDILVPSNISVEVNKSKIVNITTLPTWADIPILDIFSNNESVALIKDGKVWGVSEGSAVVTVKCGSITKTIPVTVIASTGDSNPGTTGTPVELEPVITPTIPTNKSIDIPLNITGDIEYIELPNGNKYYGDLDKYSVFENGFYSFTVHGKDGSKSSQSVTITNIDKEAPMLTFSYGVDFKSVFIKAYDNVAVNRIDVPKTSLSVNNSELTYPLSDATAYGTVVATDSTGNYSSKDININSIGSGSGSSITYYALENIPVDWTNKDVSIKAAAFNEDGLVKSISIDEGVKSTFKSRSKPSLFTSKNISSNGIYNLRVTGTDNSETTKTFVVDKIDKNAPVISLTDNGGVISYEVTDNLSGIKAIEFPDGSIREIPSDKQLHNAGSIGLSHGTVVFKVRDYAGNVSSTSITISSNPNPNPNPNPGGGGGSGGTGTPEVPVAKPETEPDTPDIGKDKEGNQIELNHMIKVNKDALVNGFVAGYKDKKVKATNSITRAEFVVMVDRIISSSNSQFIEFKDVQQDWYKNEIKRMSSLNLIIGDGHGNFMPEKYISREDVALVLSRIIILSKYSKSSTLVDIGESYAKEEISKLFNAGIISGDKFSKFKPKDNITRAEAVSMLNRVFLNNARVKNNIFADLKEEDWYYNDILMAVIENT